MRNVVLLQACTLNYTWGPAQAKIPEAKPFRGSFRMNSILSLEEFFVVNSVSQTGK